MAFVPVQVRFRFTQPNRADPPGTKIPATGSVRFRPSAPLIDSASNDLAGAIEHSVVLNPATGEGYTYLVANDTATVEPEGTSWHVTEHLDGQSPDVEYDIEITEAMAAAGVDLADIPHSVPGPAVVTYALASELESHEAGTAADNVHAGYLTDLPVGENVWESKQFFKNGYPRIDVAAFRKDMAGAAMPTGLVTDEAYIQAALNAGGALVAAGLGGCEVVLNNADNAWRWNFLDVPVGVCFVIERSAKGEKWDSTGGTAPRQGMINLPTATESSRAGAVVHGILDGRRDLVDVIGWSGVWALRCIDWVIEAPGEIGEFPDGCVKLRNVGRGTLGRLRRLHHATLNNLELSGTATLVGGLPGDGYDGPVAIPALEDIVFLDEVVCEVADDPSGENGQNFFIGQSSADGDNVWRNITIPVVICREGVRGWQTEINVPGKVMRDIAVGKMIVEDCPNNGVGLVSSTGTIDTIHARRIGTAAMLAAGADCAALGISQNSEYAIGMVDVDDERASGADYTRTAIRVNGAGECSIGTIRAKGVKTALDLTGATKRLTLGDGQAVAGSLVAGSVGAVWHGNSNTGELVGLERLRLSGFVTTFGIDADNGPESRTPVGTIDGSDPWNPPSIAVGASSSFTFNVAGLKITDEVVGANFSTALPAGMVLVMNVGPADGQATATLINRTAGAVDLAAGTIWGRFRQVRKRG